MSVRSSIGIGVVFLAVPGLAACGGEKSTPASSTVSRPASMSTTTVTVTSSSAPSTTSTSATSTSATSTGTTSASAPMVGGMTECTKEALAGPATQAAQALGPDNVYTVDQLSCADGWAVTSGVLASKDNPQMGAPTSFVFQQEGQFWVPQDKAKVCGTNPTTTTPPDDAVIPAALFLPGCAAG